MSETIYWTLVGSPTGRLETAAGFLSPSETEKLSSLRFQKRRDEWLLGRWAAKSLIHSLPTYQHFSLQEIEIRNAPAGAPGIYPPGGSASPDCLSISHRDQQALCALSLGSNLRIGADLETVEPRTAAFVADYFTPAEQSLVNTYPVARRDEAIALIWSAKESMLKALGVGLHWDTRQVEILAIEEKPDIQAFSQCWLALQVADHAKPSRTWQAWWRRQGAYVLTLAGFSVQPVTAQAARLVEKGLGSI